MPLWDHVIGYEERRPDVMERLACGYPRFLIHPEVQALFRRATDELAEPGETAFVFPARRTAERCARFVTEKGGRPPRLAPFGTSELWVLLACEEGALLAKSFWQHYGEIISSRRAEAALNGRTRDRDAGDKAREALRRRIAKLSGAGTEDVYLYTSGMGALAAALRLCRARRPDAKTVQLGFPYVDGLKMQTVAGPGVHFFPECSEKELGEVFELIEREELAAVFCEIPGNPLLSSVPLRDLSVRLRDRGIPLIVDDTVATFANVDLLPHADLVASSLTKLFSGTGDVMAGSLVFSPQSALRDELVVLHTREHDDTLWDDDAIALEENSRDFEARADQVNQTTLALCTWLRDHPAVERVYYPAFTAREAYDQVRRPHGGYGCLFSMDLKDAAHRAPAFYDHLRVSKGPSLGTNYTLASPYTLLAHYDELPWAESHGISRHLIRVSVGLESLEDLQRRFTEAFAAA
jgi:cystathionine gamma-synthase